MTLEEINKIIDEYDIKGLEELSKSTREMMKNVAQRAFEAGVKHGLETVTKIQEEILKERNII